jgi:hypothetical protein
LTKIPSFKLWSENSQHFAANDTTILYSTCCFCYCIVEICKRNSSNIDFSR